MQSPESKSDKTIPDNFISRMVNSLRELSLNEYTYTILLSVAIGLLGGFGSVLFRYLILFFQQLFYGKGDMLSLVSALPWYYVISIPAIGGLLLGPLVYYFPQEAKGHGVPEVMEAVALKGGKIKARVVVLRSFASAICLGSGGAVGREGPIVQIGSAIGSTLGQYFKVSSNVLKTMVGCGAAAGIAAAFNAPIAGVMFSLEIILGDFGVSTFAPIVLSAVTATIVSRAVFGNFPAFIAPKYELVSFYEVSFYTVLGIIIGLLALLFIFILSRMEDGFEGIGIPVYLKTAIGGLLLGSIGIFFPHVFGNGYETIDMSLIGQLSWYLLLALLFMKMLATSLTLGSGGSGGIFAPSLFMGAMAGGVIGKLVNALFPTLTASPGAYSLVGMGAMVAAATHAPITAIIILFELTNDYKIILPIMITSVVATLTSTLLKKESIYTIKLVRRGINIKSGRETHMMKSVLVKDAMNKKVEVIREDMPFKELIQFVPNSRHTNFPVVDAKGKLTGIISLQDFREVIFEENLEDLIVVKELATAEVITVTPDQNLSDALTKIGFRNIEQLPVVDEEDPRKIVGMLSRRDIITAYNKALLEKKLKQ
ncbi:MAG: chloride channel protein [Thermodesulfobacteriota bacterium]